MRLESKGFTSNQLHVLTLGERFEYAAKLYCIAFNTEDGSPVYMQGMFDAVGCLSEREQRILWGRLVDGKTLEKIGESFGITRERVRQIESDAVSHLRSICGSKLLCVSEIMSKYIEANKRADEAVASLIDTSSVREDREVLMNRLLVFSKEHDVYTAEQIEALLSVNPSEVLLWDLGLSARTYNSLKAVGVETFADLLNMSEYELSCIRHFGAKCLNEVRDKVTALGYTLKRRVAGEATDFTDDEMRVISRWRSLPPPVRKRLYRGCE